MQGVRHGMRSDAIIGQTVLRLVGAGVVVERNEARDRRDLRHLPRRSEGQESAEDLGARLRAVVLERIYVRLRRQHVCRQGEGPNGKLIVGILGDFQPRRSHVWVVNNILVIGVIFIAAMIAIGFIVGLMESRLKKKLQRQERERLDREREDLQRREQENRQRQEREHQDSWSRNDRPAPNADRRDPYVILGVRRGATFEEIHVIYRGLAKLLHPDKGGAVDPERMKDLNWAMDTIRQDFGK
jgi:hypothetical protein